MGYETLPRLPLALLPTPLEELANLRRRIGGPRVLIKRDDLNGLGMGGNKLRKLEFLLGDALAKGCDTIITSGDGQTNHGRLTAAACAKLGLRCYLVITSDPTEAFEGNQVLQYLFGATEIYADVNTSVLPEQMAKERLRAGEAKIAELVAALTQAGRKPYVIPRGGRSLYATASYCRALTEEVRPQLAALHVDKLDTIIAPCATSSTLTGILLGNKVSGLNAAVIGITLSRSVQEGKQMVLEEYTRDAAAMGYTYPLIEAELDLRGGYMGDGYGIPTEAGLEAIKLLAETEGILLDPTYSGKMMAAYLDLVLQKQLRREDTVLLFHTGGTPLLFLQRTTEKIKAMKARGR